MNPSESTRRSFLKTSAAGVAAGSLALQANKAKAADANSKLRIGFVGVGGRGFGAHVKSLSKIAKEGANIELVAVCDVYDANRNRAADYIEQENGGKVARYVDFREMYAKENLDAVSIGTPDHWHAIQAIEGMKAGMHVYCEKPMVKQVEEAIELVKVWKDSGKVMQVGVQGTSLPVWDAAREKVNEGMLGKVLMYQTEYFRNSDIGQWRYYKLSKDMSPKTIDWKRFLGVEEGLAEDQPFDRAVFAQWRRFWEFGSGMYTDLFVHRTTQMMKATGLRYPARVTGSGGLYLEYDGREVPDVATVVAEFNEGAQGLVTATMGASETPVQQLIRGHFGSIVFDDPSFDEFSFVPERPQVTHISPTELPYEKQVIRPEKRAPKDQTKAHFENWIKAIEDNTPETCNNPPDLGAAAIVLVNLGARSYREGKIYRFDDQKMEISEADGSWSKQWEKRSKERGTPSHVAGWKAGDKGSTIENPDYQSLEGPWIDGKDPAA
ncbi:gfo/Idh/MocA family oxidoreductase [Bremerella cremea]|uniref:Oxidoreductase n=1 Tax=Blastopirellula marina TaxID=124 RepID=A0A2S8FIN0_9BACT|nr:MULTISPECIES: Gfo/Idh/MocA family oxidoreductase [Pirellulaceae]PQO31900.1 oxidoreductase [Blastopirellula marina]RCS44966.1 gfo/Idh/MocA family oxidoreductase [Bremerella cremea]